MTRGGMRLAIKDLMLNGNTKKGINKFEKYLGRIEWLHGEEDENRAKEMTAKVQEHWGEIIQENRGRRKKREE